MKNLFLSFVKSTFFRQLLMAVLFLVILIFALLSWLKSSTNHGQKLAVPDLSKKTLSEVAKVLETHKMQYVVLDSANYNPEYPRFSVIDQTPKPGSFVKENRKIYLTINPSDFNEVTIPNIIQKTYRQAAPTLTSLGFRIGDTLYRPNLGKDVVLEIQFRNKKVNPGDKLKKKFGVVLNSG